MATLQTVIASVNYTNLIVAIVFFILLLRFLGRKGNPWNWPLIGMLPILFPIFTSIFDRITEVLECNRGTFEYKGPWFCKRDMIVTCDPENVQHILSSNFSNYPKGSDTKVQFEPFGLFLFTQDFNKWRSHRKITHEFLNSQEIRLSTPKVNLEIIEKELIPVLDYACEQGVVIDLQDVIRRYMLDAAMIISIGYSHSSLGIGFKEDPVLAAMHDVNKGILMRHILPEKFWKIQRWLGLGQEKKMSEALKLIDNFVSMLIERRKRQESISTDSHQEEFYAIRLLPAGYELMFAGIIKGLLFAATDTSSSALTWFFMLVKENRAIESRIREEIEVNLSTNKSEKRLIYHPAELNKLVYLHAAVLESIRLFPSAPFQIRTCMKQDIMPSGHRVISGKKVVISPYAMGRIKSVWGEDCHQFRPERWISDTGRIIPTPSSKFSAFSSGPRICPGKELGLIRMKAVAATIIHNYDIHHMKGNLRTPATAIMMDMKYGLKTTITKRSASVSIL